MSLQAAEKDWKKRRLLEGVPQEIKEEITEAHV
jgi:hypothetical protein